MREPKIVKLKRTPVEAGIHILDELDDEQREAVVNATGRCLIIAGPGSGKTRTITHKLAYLVESGVPPDKILLVTFTRRAAADMLVRAQAATKIGLTGMLAGTFHHVCNVILRHYGAATGLNPNFTILDDEDSRTLIKICRRAHLSKYPGGTEPKLPSPTVLQNVFSLSANTLMSLDEVIKREHPAFVNILEDVSSILKEYRKRKKSQGVLDYDDLLLESHALLKSNEGVKQKLASRFRWVLVDEFQDTSLVQAEIAELLSSVHGNLIVVGDDAQSIYSFRGARYENITDFSGLTGCKVFKLQTNYRSTPEIVELINNSTPNNVFEKKLKSRRSSGPLPVVATTRNKQDEAVFVAQKIVEYVNAGVAPNEIGVLYRAHAHSIELQVELTRRGISFDIYSGVRFTEAAHVKDILSFLRIVQNPADQIGWSRALGLFEGIGRITSERIFDEVQEEISAGRDPFEWLREKELRRARGFAEFKKKVLPLKPMKSPSKIVDSVYKTFYKQYLELKYPNFRERRMDIERLIEISGRYDSVQRFLSDLFLSKRIEIEREGNGGEPKVILSTVHQAKGLEWPVVFVLSLNPGDFPSSWAVAEGNLDEEERIFYVAMTRAKDELFLSRQQLAEMSFRSDYFTIRSGSLDFIRGISDELVDSWVVE